MRMLLLYLLLTVQCCVLGMPLNDSDDGSVNSNCHVSMRLLHEVYSSFCRMGIGSCFFRDMERYDPAMPENGMKTLEERYHAWREANHVEIPHMEVTAVVSMEFCHMAYSDFRATILREDDDDFFEHMNAYDPSSEINGGKDLRTRYEAWRIAKGKAIPPLGAQSLHIPS